MFLWSAFNRLLNNKKLTNILPLLESGFLSQIYLTKPLSSMLIFHPFVAPSKMEVLFLIFHFAPLVLYLVLIFRLVLLRKLYLGWMLIRHMELIKFRLLCWSCVATKLLSLLKSFLTSLWLLVSSHHHGSWPMFSRFTRKIADNSNLTIVQSHYSPFSAKFLKSLYLTLCMVFL